MNTVLCQSNQFYTLVVNMKSVNVSITDKDKALQKIAEGSCTKKKIAEQYGVKKNTVSTWIANKAKITQAYETGHS